MAGSAFVTRAISIAVGAATTAEIDLEGRSLVGVVTPSTFDGTTLTPTVAVSEGGTYYNVYGRDGTQYTITTSASRLTYVDMDVSFGWRWLKLTSDSNQADTTTALVLLLRDV